MWNYLVKNKSGIILSSKVKNTVLIFLLPTSHKYGGNSWIILKKWHQTIEIKLIKKWKVKGQKNEISMAEKHINKCPTS